MNIFKWVIIYFLISISLHGDNSHISYIVDYRDKRVTTWESSDIGIDFEILDEEKLVYEDDFSPKNKMVFGQEVKINSSEFAVYLEVYKSNYLSGFSWEDFYALSHADRGNLVLSFSMLGFPSSKISQWSEHTDRMRKCLKNKSRHLFDEHSEKKLLRTIEIDGKPEFVYKDFTHEELDNLETTRNNPIMPTVAICQYQSLSTLR